MNGGTAPPSPPGKNYGAFVFHHEGRILRAISSGSGSDRQWGEWEHVSVSLEDRCPTWQEMQFIKEQFWDDEETVIQFHPKKSEYRNFHTHVLHMWRHRDGHPLPPTQLI